MCQLLESVLAGGLSVGRMEQGRREVKAVDGNNVNVNEKGRENKERRGQRKEEAKENEKERGE